MNQSNGYIYVRNHPSYDGDDACKIGKTTNILNKDMQYATCKIKRGYFEVVFEIPIKMMGIIECLIHNEFCDLNVKYAAGTNFYNKEIIMRIEPYLITLGIKYRKLSKQEISNLIEDCDNNINENMKPLGELCCFKSGKQLTKSNFKIGIYPVIGTGQTPKGLHNEFNKDKNTILCMSRGAYAGLISKYEYEVWACDCFSIHSKNKMILDEKYLYYYLKSIQTKIYKLHSGTVNTRIYLQSVKNLKIPLPSMKQQISIIEFYESNQVKINELENEIKKIKEIETNYISNIFKLNNAQAE